MRAVFPEYRRGLGFNGEMIANPSDIVGISASVYIMCYPIRTVTCGGVTQCAPDNLTAQSWIPGTRPDDVLIRADKPAYWDPHRKIRITMTERNGRNATVRIEHERE